MSYQTTITIDQPDVDGNGQVSGDPEIVILAKYSIDLIPVEIKRPHKEPVMLYLTTHEARKLSNALDDAIATADYYPLTEFKAMDIKGFEDGDGRGDFEVRRNDTHEDSEASHA